MATSKHNTESRPDSNKTESVPGEYETAMKKILLKKAYNTDTEAKTINLNSVSAFCPILNLNKNKYHELYLKANQISHYHL